MLLTSACRITVKTPLQQEKTTPGLTPIQTQSPATEPVRNIEPIEAPVERQTEPPSASDDWETELENLIISELERHSTVIDIAAFNLNSDDAGDFYMYILDQHPELFYVGKEVQWSYYANGATTEVYPSYRVTAEEQDKYIAEFDTAVTIAINAVPQGLSARETIAEVNDYLCKNAEYAFNRYGEPDDDRVTAYDILVNGYGVCDGYAAAFGVLMDKIGIQWRRVSSEVMNHAWNQVFIEGQWLHVDVTWDDPTPDHSGEARRDYLLLTDEEISSGDDPHYSWEYWE
jgi:transglutaminase-like putative cysteine protease